MSDAEKVRLAFEQGMCCSNGVCAKLPDCGKKEAWTAEINQSLINLDAAGFALVPKVATDAMVTAGARRIGSVHSAAERQAAWVYEGMIDAAPKVTP